MFLTDLGTLDIVFGRRIKQGTAGGKVKEAREGRKEKRKMK
jgi:hypothetical protein